MTHYRLYILDRDDHIRHAESLECEDDPEAIDLARARLDGRAIEIWQGTRRVTRLEAQ